MAIRKSAARLGCQQKNAAGPAAGSDEQLTLAQLFRPSSLRHTAARVPAIGRQRQHGELHNSAPHNGSCYANYVGFDAICCE